MEFIKTCRNFSAKTHELGSSKILEFCFDFGEDYVHTFISCICLSLSLLTPSRVCVYNKLTLIKEHILFLDNISYVGTKIQQESNLWSFCKRGSGAWLRFAKKREKRINEKDIRAENVNSNSPKLPSPNEPITQSIHEKYSAFLNLFFYFQTLWRNSTKIQLTDTKIWNVSLIRKVLQNFHKTFEPNDW